MKSFVFLIIVFCKYCEYIFRKSLFIYFSGVLKSQRAANLWLLYKHKNETWKYQQLCLLRNSRWIVWVCLTIDCNFFNKETPAQVFSSVFAKFLRTPVFTEQLWWQLLKILKFLVIFSDVFAFFSNKVLDD